MDNAADKIFTGEAVVGACFGGNAIYAGYVNNDNYGDIYICDWLAQSKPAFINASVPQVLFLLKTNLLYGMAGLVLFTWFCAFGCQSRSEAGSLVAMFGVFIGWGIILLWSNLCEVAWAERFVPYSLMLMRITEVEPVETAFSQSLAFVAVLVIACYRYVSIRRYL